MALATASPEQKYSSRTTYSLASPFLNPAWPEISPSDQDTIRNLFCRLITPIGEYRRKYIEPSQGKRARKRRRILESTKNNEGETTIPRPTPPPEPAILRDITVGYNSTHRALQESLEAQTPAVSAASSEHEVAGESRKAVRRLAAVFVDRFSQAKIMHNHLPILIAASSIEERTPIRLTMLPSRSEAQLSSALSVPRVGMIGLYEDAVGAGPLIQLIRDKVPIIDGSWLKGVGASKYLPLQIDVKTTKVAALATKSIKEQNTKKGGGTKSLNKSK